jgi:hypothetical protein
MRIRLGLRHHRGRQNCSAQCCHDDFHARSHSRPHMLFFVAPGPLSSAYPAVHKTSAGHEIVLENIAFTPI